ncbi:hypothetical protein [Pseudofrankia saprophytica]|uniref:hypothetical protein n=1 Tax=Pseudofrankia saprophytica TaxID=298655 RepID=UPI00030B48E2|nr:hypothetical protein [Pseudofrankia saprophytica]
MTRYGTPPGGQPESRGALAVDATHVGTPGDASALPARGVTTREAGRLGAVRHSRVAAA